MFLSALECSGLSFHITHWIASGKPVVTICYFAVVMDKQRCGSKDEFISKHLRPVHSWDSFLHV